MLPAEFKARLKALLPPERLFTDPVDCYAYAYDNSRRISPPAAVAFPVAAEEAQAIVRLCFEHGVAATARGRGTGTAGGSIPEAGGVALSLERMVRILSVDPANRVMVVEPGVLNQEVQDAARPHGLFWPPDPSSAAYSSVGGNLATCAGGPHAVKYGTARDHVLGLKAVTGAGEIVRTGCYTTKGVVGYDLTRLLVGSEGTLAIIVEATLKLTPLPAGAAGVVAWYRDAGGCAAAIARIMGQPMVPSALEFLDAGALALLRAHYADMVPAEAGALLMIEVDGTPSDLEQASAAILAACGGTGLLEAKAAADSAALWAARKALSPLLRDIAPKKINEDIVVPVTRIPELLEGLAELSRKYQVANVNFGHAGNGNLHVNLLVDPEQSGEMERGRKCLDEVFDLVLRLSGTLSGEHGIGSEKRQFVGKEIDAATLELMRGIKRVFDPRGILNPGKLFPED